MQRRQWISAAAWAVSVLMGVPVRAADPAEGRPLPSAVSEEPQPSGDDAAADAFRRALAAYDAKDLAGALTAMRESYRLSGRTELLYNIARIEHELGACTDALFDYRQYLEQVPDGLYRSDAEQASQALSARCPPSPVAPAASPASAPSTPAVPAPEPPPPPASPGPNNGTLQRGLGWTAVGVGVVAAASALYFRQRAKDDKTSYEQAVAIEQAGGPLSNPELASDQRRHENIALALAFGSGALVAGGVALLVLAPRGNGGSAARTTVYLSPALLGFSVVRNF